MRALAAAVIVLAFGVVAAYAGDAVSHQEAKSIQEALHALDCYGGEMETKSDGSTAYKVEKAVCKDGENEFKLDKDFNIISQKRD